MMKTTKMVFGAALALSCAGTANAATYEWYLDSYAPGAEQNFVTYDPTFSWGTVTLADNGTGVDVTIDLVDDYKPLTLWLNYSGAVGDEDDWSAGSFGVNSDTNPWVSFDLQIPENGNFGNVNSVTFSLTKDMTDLDASMFALAQFGAYAVVHVACSDPRAALASVDGGVNGNCPNGSVWAGATDELGPPAEVPLPGAVWLFGSALLGFVTWSRRRAA